MSPYPSFTCSLPPHEATAGRYSVRFARSPVELRGVQSLRYEVFRREQGLGDASWDAARLDDEPLDESSHHLVVEHDGDPVGTYRLRTFEQAQRAGGFYSEADFGLRALDEGVRRRGVELSRACVSEKHRNGRVLLLLWKGLARYMTHNSLQHVFGCCSVPTMSGPVAWSLYDHFVAEDRLHPQRRLEVAEERRCERSRGAATELGPPETNLPPLFHSYLRLGARVCSAPALDRSFQVVSFFVTLDLEDMNPATRRTLFRRGTA